MKRFFIAYLFIFYSCNQKSEPLTKIQKVAVAKAPFGEKKTQASSVKPDEKDMFKDVPFHNISYTDSIKLCSSKINVDTTVRFVKSNKHQISFLINTIDKRVLRYHSDRKEEWRADGATVEDEELSWTNVKGNPTEFIGEDLYTSHYFGGELEGSITKYKYRIEGNSLVLVDSLSGGMYSEGAGTWEWVLSKKGKPIGVAFFDIIEDMNDSLLLIRGEGKPERYIINTVTLDTTSKLSETVGVWQAKINGDKIIYNYWARDDRHYIALLNRKGSLLWISNTDFYYETLSDYKNNLIFGAALLGKDKKKKTSIVAHSLENGQVSWNFPLKKFSKREAPRVKNLFKIGGELYGALIEEYHVFDDQKGINYDLTLIVFNSSGEICKTLDIVSLEKKLPEILVEEVFTFVSETENEFKLVSKQRTIEFTLKNEERHLD